MQVRKEGRQFFSPKQKPIRISYDSDAMRLLTASTPHKKRDSRGDESISALSSDGM